MKHCAVCFLLFLLFSAGTPGVAQDSAEMPSSKRKFGFVVHGGAGTILRSQMTTEREKEIRAALERGLRAGYELLKADGSSLDAVEAAVRVLEDDPHFNAGKGAVFTRDGTHELDAAIMDGQTMRAGAACSLKHIKNPISLARLVMEKSGHVMMDGGGAEAFAKENGVELVDQKYFFTQFRLDELKREQAKPKTTPGGGHGTVGAVALDQEGNLAAATSTGGTVNKRPGRVGDSPIIGAGNYANAICAVSATGDGEYFIRATVARDVAALMEYRGMSVEEAGKTALDKVAKLGGSGGLIAIDAKGNITLPFNTAGMYRGYVSPEGKFVVEIYR